MINTNTENNKAKTASLIKIDCNHFISDNLETVKQILIGCKLPENNVNLALNANGKLIDFTSKSEFYFPRSFTFYQNADINSSALKILQKYLMQFKAVYTEQAKMNAGQLIAFAEKDNHMLLMTNANYAHLIVNNLNKITSKYLVNFIALIRGIGDNFAQEVLATLNSASVFTPTAINIIVQYLQDYYKHEKKETPTIKVLFKLILNTFQEQEHGLNVLSNKISLAYDQFLILLANAKKGKATLPLISLFSISAPDVSTADKETIAGMKITVKIIGEEDLALFLNHLVTLNKQEQVSLLQAIKLLNVKLTKSEQKEVICWVLRSSSFFCTQNCQQFITDFRMALKIDPTHEIEHDYNVGK